MKKMKKMMIFSKKKNMKKMKMTRKKKAETNLWKVWKAKEVDPKYLSNGAESSTWAPMILSISRSSSWLQTYCFQMQWQLHWQECRRLKSGARYSGLKITSRKATIWEWQEINSTRSSWRSWVRRRPWLGRSSEREPLQWIIKQMLLMLRHILGLRRY